MDFILSRKRYSENNFDDYAFGVERLKSSQVYCAAYPLHQVNQLIVSKAGVHFEFW